MNFETEGRLLNGIEDARILNISKALAYRMMQKGEIKVVRFGKSVRVSNFLDDDCEKLIETIRTTSATLTPKIWISATKAIGIESKAGKNGGTMAHTEIAEAFRAWLFPEVMLEMVKRFRSYQLELG